MAASVGFIDLDRRFQRLSPNLKPEEAAFESYSHALGGDGYGLCWSDLLKQRLVVILGEPGSGKTEEFKQQTRSGIASGSYKFFIRLDQLATQSLEFVLGPADYRRYRVWRQDKSGAFFFLDSVDEAKFLKLSDFHVALDRFRNAVGANALTRAQIFLSCRISEWQPQSDPTELLERFPQPPPSLRNQDDKSGNVEIDDTEKSAPLLIVQLKPLDKSRVETFAKARGVPNLEDFIAALDTSHAWEFVRRPVDVIDLANFWRERGRLGSLTELIELNIENNLRASTRDQNDSLSPQEAREGAESLAASVVFCRRFGFKVPDSTFLVEDAMDAFSVVAEYWRTEQVRALLNRPLFDSAAYGRIRFHHRRVTEYLAATWLTARMKRGCPTTELKELLFKLHDERLIIRPAMAPVAAWLCCGNESWNNDVRSWVVEAAPKIHLQYGDPACLPVEHKRRMLGALVRAYQGRSRVWITSNSDSLARLVDPAISQEISTMVRDRTLSPDLRVELIQAVRHGRVVQALDAVVEVIARSDEPDHLKSYAATAVRDAGDAPSRRRLAEIAASFTTIPNTLCSRILEALYPETIDASALIALLWKTEPVPSFSVDIPYYLRTHLKSVIRTENVADMLERLVELGQTPPHLTLDYKATPISQRFYWLGQVVPTLIDILLRRANLAPAETETVAKALWWVGLFRDHPIEFGDEKLQNVNELTRRHPNVRQRYFWWQVNQWRTQHDSEPKDQFDIFENYEEIHPEKEDIEWLATDVTTQIDPKDRRVALQFAIELWWHLGSRSRDRRRIRAAVANDDVLRSMFKQRVKGSAWRRFRHSWNWYTHRLNRGWRWEQRLRRLKILRNWLRSQWFFLRRIRRLASGNEPHWLIVLVTEALEGHSQWSNINWQTLHKKRGRLVAWAGRQGCKKAWRKFVPKLPYEADPSQTDRRVIVGLVGIEAEKADGEIDFSRLNGNEAEIAARYAISELNGFAPWLGELALHRTESVRSVLSECVRGEWAFKDDRGHVYEVMHDLVWHGDTLSELVKESLLELLNLGDPPNHTILRYALTILLAQKEWPISELSAIVLRRVTGYRFTDPAFILWMAVWLQIDARSALAFLQEVLNDAHQPGQAVLQICSALSGEYRDRSPLVPNPSYMRSAMLRSFIPLIYVYVQPKDDIDRTGSGVYTPEDRDHVQNYRTGLLSRLAASEEVEATAVLRELAAEPIMAPHCDWILHLLDERFEREADLPQWNPKDIRSFEIEHEADPKNDRDLFKIACKRLNEIKNDVEKSDNSLRDELRSGDQERRLRQWLARKLNERSRKRYNLPQEEEIDQQEKPDLRFENPCTDPVSIEIKWAHKWTVSELLDGLEKQLVDQYLRAHNSRQGVYILGMIDSKKYWEYPTSQDHLSFPQVVEVVRARSKELVRNREDVENLAVIDIDFRAPNAKS